MKRFLPSNIRLVVVLALVATTSAACVRPDKPSVAINKLEANLVFGVTKPPEEVPATPVEQVLSGAADAQDLFAAFDFPSAPSPGFGTIPLFTQPKSECPAAAPDAAPEKATEATITGDPLVGVSKYKITGFLTDRTGQVPFGDSRFERRIVRKFLKESATVSTFEVVQPVLGASDRLIVTKYRVNTAGLSRNPSDGVGIITTPGVGEPERGITIDRIAEVDKNGTELATFEPTTGLLLLPLPVTSGERFQSAAVDPRTGQTIAHESTVTRRQRIDACGNLVDGWLVESNRAVSRNPAAQSVAATSGKYSLILATQYGGLPVQERFTVDTGCPVGPCDLVSTLGQLKPDSLPPGNE